MTRSNLLTDRNSRYAKVDPFGRKRRISCLYLFDTEDLYMKASMLVSPIKTSMASTPSVEPS